MQILLLMLQLLTFQTTLTAQHGCGGDNYLYPLQNNSKRWTMLKKNYIHGHESIKRLKKTVLLQTDS